VVSEQLWAQQQLTPLDQALGEATTPKLADTYRTRLWIVLFGQENQT
jgi:hypothetical protein